MTAEDEQPAPDDPQPQPREPRTLVRKRALAEEYARLTPPPPAVYNPFD